MRCTTKAFKVEKLRAQGYIDFYDPLYQEMLDEQAALPEKLKRIKSPNKLKCPTMNKYNAREVGKYIDCTYCGLKILARKYYKHIDERHHVQKELRKRKISDSDATAEEQLSHIDHPDFTMSVNKHSLNGVIQICTKGSVTRCSEVTAPLSCPPPGELAHAQRRRSQRRPFINAG